jgi:hypothetical protein
MTYSLHDVGRVGGSAFGLGIDALKPGLVGAGGAGSVGVDAAGRLPRPANYRWSL